MNVYFVGMHNKPRMEPFDSKTVSGRLLDRIIYKLPGVYCFKTNLCEIEYLPTNSEEIYENIKKWSEKYNPQREELVVLLGKWVHKQWFNASYGDVNVISIPHPASIFGAFREVEYVEKTVREINKQLAYLNPHKFTFVYNPHRL